MQAKERIILALDVDTEDEAMTLVEKLRGHVRRVQGGDATLYCSRP